MDDDHHDLELRRHSVRTLTDPELSRANAGAANGTGNGSCYGSGCGTNRPRTQTK